jgi:MFS family permease
LEGLTNDVKMTGDQYLTGLTTYFIGYVLFEIPCNIILKRTSPRLWLPTVALIWGIVATLLGVVSNLAGYLTSRFFLGVAESGLFPGVVFYMSMWYKRNEQHYRIALFFSAASLAGAFGGILAWVSPVPRARETTYNPLTRSRELAIWPVLVDITAGDGFLFL